MVIDQDTWQPENWAACTPSKRLSAMCPPLKTLLIMLTGNQCAVCGKRFLVW
jgi:hypothetical protein